MRTKMAEINGIKIKKQYENDKHRHKTKDFGLVNALKEDFIRNFI